MGECSEHVRKSLVERADPERSPDRVARFARKHRGHVSGLSFCGAIEHIREPVA